MAAGITRRNFVRAAAAAVSGVGFAGSGQARLTPAESKPLALLGGTPLRQGGWPEWPVIGANDEKAWIEVLRKRRWNRWSGPNVKAFEQKWAQTLGAKYVQAVNGGTSALVTAMAALEVGPHDEVLVPPYTYVATINPILLFNALPVFVDTDPETFLIDARKLEAAITPRTRCILPVHIGGSVADLDTILSVAKKHNLPVVEDACQCWTGEWHQRRAGTLGTIGCMSFQASKNFNSGEGGVFITDDQSLYEFAYRFQSNGSSPGVPAASAINGLNFRLTEFQGALLLEQLTRLEEQSQTRERNAAYLTSLLSEIPGIKPARMYPGCTRNAWHLYMLRYDKEAFAGVSRDRFIKALMAEGFPGEGGYTQLNRQPFLKQTMNSRAFKAIYPPKEIGEWEERNRCPMNDKLCAEEAVWFPQTSLLGPRSDMDQIAEAFRKIQANAHLLANA